MKRFGQTLVAAAGVAALGLVFAAMARLGNLGLYVVETIALSLGAGILYFVALYAFERTAERRAAFWLILAGAVLFRLLLFPLPPTLSDDIHRYRFDGRMQIAGWDPYALRPDDPRLVSLRDASWPVLPGRDIPSVYPPLLELAFAAIYRVLPGPVAFKLGFLSLDLLILGLLAGWLRSTGGKNVQLVVYAWNPLVVVEFAASGHNDPLALAAMLGAFLLMLNRNKQPAPNEKSYRLADTVSTLLLAAAALVKAFPLLLFPLWMRRQGWPRQVRAWTNGLAAVALAAVCVWPYRGVWFGFAGGKWPQLVDSLADYEARWHHNNASLYALFAWFSGSRELAAGLGVGVAAGLALWAAARQLDILRAAYVLFGAVLLLAPNAFSWYFTWMVLLICFMPVRGSAVAWLLLSVLQFLSYHVLIDYQASHTWHFQPFFLWLTYGPFYAYLLMDSVRGEKVAANAPHQNSSTVFAAPRAHSATAGRTAVRLRRTAGARHQAGVAPRPSVS